MEKEGLIPPVRSASGSHRTEGLGCEAEGSGSRGRQHQRAGHLLKKVRVYRGRCSEVTLRTAVCPRGSEACFLQDRKVTS